MDSRLDGLVMCTLNQYPFSPVTDDKKSAIKAAFRQVEEMDKAGWWCQLRTPWTTPDEGNDFWAGFTPKGMTGWNGRPDNWTQAETIEHAICLAALKAKGVEG